MYVYMYTNTCIYVQLSPSVFFRANSPNCTWRVGVGVSGGVAQSWIVPAQSG